MISKASIISEITVNVLDLIDLKNQSKHLQFANKLRRMAKHGIHIKQVEDLERSLTKELIPFFQNQIDSIVSNLNSLQKKSSTSEASVIIDLVFDSRKWDEELKNIVLPILANSMIKVIEDQMSRLGVSLAKSTTASDWLENHQDDWDELAELMEAEGFQIATEFPVWMKLSISRILTQTFEQDYWESINDTTGADAEKFLKEGLLKGWSIRRIAREMASDFEGGTSKYNRMRATRIARTESANALNGARRAGIDNLINDLGPQIPMKPTWLSVLADTTRDAHAALDGVPADEDGLWSLGGVRIPWPAHYSLPDENRINCLCTVSLEFGMQEDEALQLIQEHEQRVREMNAL